MTRGNLLGRTALPAVLIAATLLSAPAYAQSAAAGPDTANASEDTPQDEEITVTAARTQTAVAEIPGSVSILSGETLQDQLDISVDLNDVLNKAVPGLAANNDRGFSNGRGPLLRGRPASVLINGVPVNQLLRSSGFDLGLIDPLAIERIEVNRGASAVFGFGASGGVINVLTRRARSEDLEVIARSQVAFSPNDFNDSLSFKGYASGGVKNPNGSDFQLGAGFSTIGATIDPNGDIVQSQAVNVYNIDGNAGFEWENGAALRASGNFFRRDFRKDYVGPGPTFGACVTDACDTIVGGYDRRVAISSPEQNVKDQYQQNYVLSVNFTHPEILGSALDLTGYVQKNTFQYQDIFSDFGDPPALAYGQNNQNNRRLGFRSNLTTTFELAAERSLAFTYGFDYLRDKIDRPFFNGGPNTANLRYAPVPTLKTYSLGAETRPLSPPITLASYAGFLQAKFEAGPVILQGGIRHEEFRPRSDGKTIANFFGAGQDLIYLEGKMPKFNATLFNAGIVYSFTDDTEVFAGLSQGLEVTELGRAFRSLPGKGRPGNPALVAAQPAKTTQYEVGVRARFDALRFTASAFYADAPLSSQLVVVNPLLPLEPLRQPEEIWGFESTLDYRFNDAVSAGAVLTYQNGKYEDPTGTEFDLANDRVTPTRVTAFVDVTPREGLGLRLQGTQIFDRSQFPDSPPVVFGTFEGNVDGYFVLDALASLKLGAGELTLGVENLLNNSYVNVERQAFNDLNDFGRAEGTRITLGYQTKF